MRDNALIVPGHPRPAIIAHAGGNSLSAVTEAVAADADFVEVDLWVHNGRFEVRHERRAFSIPLLFERWYVKWAPRRPFELVDLLRHLAGGPGVFLDLKNGAGEAAELVRRSIEESGFDGPVVASSQSWALLRELHELCPEVIVLYSVDVAEKLDLFFSVLTHDDIPGGVSCRHTLLAPDIVSSLKERGLAVAAWTTDDPERVRELASWGVSAIATNNVGAVSAVLEPA